MCLGQNRMGFHSEKLIVEKLPRIGLLPLGDKLDSALAMVVESQANLIIKAKFNIFLCHRCQIYATDARSPENSKSLPLVSSKDISI